MATKTAVRTDTATQIIAQARAAIAARDNNARCTHKLADTTDGVVILRSLETWDKENKSHTEEGRLAFATRLSADVAKALAALRAETEARHEAYTSGATKTITMAEAGDKLAAFERRFTAPAAGYRHDAAYFASQLMTRGDKAVVKATKAIAKKYHYSLPK